MKYCAEAPGKVILTGEHFVVHGARAVVAAIGRRVLAVAQRTDETRITSINLNLEALPPHKIPQPLAPLAEAMEATRRFLGGGGHAAITVQSEIPVAQGLGSSGAVAAATVAATAAALGHPLSKESVVELAMVAERRVHGNPSGIDVNAPVYGGILIYRRGELLRPLPPQKPLRLVLGYSGVPRSTAEVISRVSSLKEASPHLFAAYVELASWLSDQATDALQGGLDILGHILNINHLLLQRVGASAPIIDDMVEVCLQAGALGAKLTGGGGGGTMIALAPADGEERLLRALSARGFKAEALALPVGGLRVWEEDQ